MKQLSAGLLIYRKIGNEVEVLVVHPGGPFWAKKDQGAWSLPKGQYDESEEPLTAAYREFSEEIGQEAPPGEAMELGEVKLKSGKLIKAWALEGNLDAGNIKSNMMSIEWPPKSGRQTQFPEVDKASWFNLVAAKQKLHPVQAEFVDRLAEKLNVPVEQKVTPQPEQSSLF